MAPPKKKRRRWDHCSIIDDYAEVRRWTNQARDCYDHLRETQSCMGCPIDGYVHSVASEPDRVLSIHKFECRMKTAVIRLVQKFGAPDANIDYEGDENICL